MKNIWVALENIRSLENTGAIMRTCSFFGVFNLVLVGYSGKTTTPGGNESLHPKINKSSLGSEKDLEIKFIKTIEELTELCKKEGLSLVAVEQAENSIPLNKLSQHNNIMLVFGNEVTGVSKNLLNHSDKIVEIKRVGKHNSLNVATSVGIVLNSLISTQEH